MTLIRPIETETTSDDVYELIEQLYEEAALDFMALSDRIKAGEAPSDADLKKELARLSGSAAQVIKERDRILEQRKRSAGIVGAYAIDFEAARVEIGRKLNLLRRARGTSPLPE